MSRSVGGLSGWLADFGWCMGQLLGRWECWFAGWLVKVGLLVGW